MHEELLSLNMQLVQVENLPTSRHGSAQHVGLGVATAPHGQDGQKKSSCRGEVSLFIHLLTDLGSMV